MIDKPEEYAHMAELEDGLWWFKIKQALVLDSIRSRFSSVDLDILDLGCGMGGLLAKLKEAGYDRARGIDLSSVAVKYCLGRGLNVTAGEILAESRRLLPYSLDVAISNDNIYHLGKSQRRETTNNICRALKPGGVFLMNLPAFAAFRGRHDILLGITQRFSRADIWDIFDANRYDCIRQAYWPALLSPLIYSIRLGQRMRDRIAPPAHAISDGEIPPRWLNSALFGLTAFEIRHLQTPFGSSLFLAMSPRS